MKSSTDPHRLHAEIQKTLCGPVANVGGLRNCKNQRSKKEKLADLIKRGFSCDLKHHWMPLNIPEQGVTC